MASISVWALHIDEAGSIMKQLAWCLGPQPLSDGSFNAVPSLQSEPTNTAAACALLSCLWPLRALTKIGFVYPIHPFHMAAL